MGLVVTLKFKKFHKDAVIPQFKTLGAACLDLVATDIEYLDENKVVVSYGFGTDIPVGYKVMLMPRSSFSHNDWVMANSPGIIDPDYRGEWKTKFDAIPVGVKLDPYGQPKLIYSHFPYNVGDRVVQASLEVAIQMNFQLVKDLDATERGAGGFGSTGNK